MEGANGRQGAGYIPPGQGRLKTEPPPPPRPYGSTRTVQNMRDAPVHLWPQSPHFKPGPLGKRAVSVAPASVKSYVNPKRMMTSLFPPKPAVFSRPPMQTPRQQPEHFPVPQFGPPNAQGYIYPPPLPVFTPLGSDWQHPAPMRQFLPVYVSPAPVPSGPAQAASSARKVSREPFAGLPKHKNKIWSTIKNALKGLLKNLIIEFHHQEAAKKPPSKGAQELEFRNPLYESLPSTPAAPTRVDGGDGYAAMEPQRDNSGISIEDLKGLFDADDDDLVDTSAQYDQALQAPSEKLSEISKYQDDFRDLVRSHLVHLADARQAMAANDMKKAYKDFGDAMYQIKGIGEGLKRMENLNLEATNRSSQMSHAQSDSDVQPEWVDGYHQSTSDANERCAGVAEYFDAMREGKNLDLAEQMPSIFSAANKLAKIENGLSRNK